MYSGLEKGLLPKVYPAKSILEVGQYRLKQALRCRDSLKNELALVKPMALTKAVAITGAKFSGYRLTLRNAYVAKSGDKLTYEVNYKNQLTRPTMAKITQKIGDVQDVVNVLFRPGAPYTRAVQKDLTDPASLVCSAEVTSELGFFKYDSLSQTYNVGLFDDRYKPTSEYPVSNVNNAELDIAYSWSVANTIYPTPLPGLTIDSLSAQLLSGFINYEGKFYKDPAVNNTVRIRARIVNNTGAPITVKHWGLPLSVLYEDNIHVSQANIDVSFATRTISSGSAYSYYLDVNLPEWAYGKVAIAHAMNMYKDSLYCYGGGGFYCIEVFRLRLP
jgi:hypothetical protein